MGSRSIRKGYAAVFAALSFLLIASYIPSAHAEATAGITLDSATSTRSSGVADGVLGDGWEWEFHFTVPLSETKFKIKFSDFTHGSDSIPASNIKFYSAQSSAHSSEGSAVSISGADTWSDTVDLTDDLDTETPNRQIVVTVEVAIPAGTPGGSYSATYDIQSDAPPVITFNGNTPVNIFVGDTYTDAGATATDETGADISSSIVVTGLPIDTSLPVPHTVTYNVTDGNGNPAVPVERLVSVNAIIGPVLTCPPLPFFFCNPPNPD